VYLLTPRRTLFGALGATLAIALVLVHALGPDARSAGSWKNESPVLHSCGGTRGSIQETERG